MKKIHQLENLEQVKAMAQTIRLQILELLKEEPLTTKQVAVILGEKPTKLYHHVDLLEHAGLIRLVETKQNRNLTEKYYQSVAKDFIVDRRALELEKGPIEALSEYESLFISTLETSLMEARQSIADKLFQSVDEGRNALLLKQKFTGSMKQMLALTELIKDWLESLPDADQNGEHEYNLTVAFYPLNGEQGS